MHFDSRLNLQVLLFAGAAMAQAQWSVGPNLNLPRVGLTVTLLPNDKVLAAGGDVTASELFDSASNTWSVSGSMATARNNQTATLLPNGKVLIAGGFIGGVATGSAELYDPATGTWHSTGNLATPRYGHSATLLNSGLVLVAGGCCDSAQPALTSLTSAELYNPATGSWTQTGSMLATRGSNAASLLADGTVLVAGGLFYRTGTFTSAEIYNPATAQWQATGAMLASRSSFGSVRLADGTVLVTGGSPGGCCGGLATSELYDPAARTWRSTGTMTTGRLSPTMTMLSDSITVVVTGGYSCCMDPIPTRCSTATYNAQTQAWTSAGNMSAPRTRHAAILFPDGRVLVSAGSTTDIFGTTGTVPPPLVAVNDSLSTRQATPLTFSGAQLLANDSAGAVIATIDAVSKSGGSIIGSGSGTYIYTPAPAFTGTDSFAYSITDGKGHTASATVSVAVADQQVQPATYFASAVSITNGKYDSGTLKSLSAEDNDTYDILSVSTTAGQVTDWYGTTNMSMSGPPSAVNQLTVTYSGVYSRSSVTQQFYLYNFSTASWDLLKSQTVGNSSDVTVTATVASPQRYISSTGEMRARIRGSRNGSGFYCWVNQLSWQVK
jgi:Cadherin-like domain/Galactose oxidase, central domain/Kelch motif